MKSIAPLLVFAFVLHHTCPLSAAEPAPLPTPSSPKVTVPVTEEEARDVKALLDQLPPSQTALWRYIWQLKSPAKDVSPEELNFANATLAKTREIIPQLRKSLKVGASIFSYPSLLAHGDINYEIIKGTGGDPFGVATTPGEYGYRLYMGIPKSEFVHIYDFELYFDSHGIIRSINSVDWKK